MKPGKTGGRFSCPRLEKCGTGNGFCSATLPQRPFPTTNLHHPEGVSLQLLVRCSNSATILSRSCAEFLDCFLGCFMIIAARTSDPSVSLTGVRAVQISCRFRHRRNPKSAPHHFPQTRTVNAVLGDTVDVYTLIQVNSDLVARATLSHVIKFETPFYRMSLVPSSPPRRPRHSFNDARI